MRKAIELAGSVVLLFAADCRGDTARAAAAVPADNPSTPAAEYFPRSLYDQAVDCAGEATLQPERPMVVLNDFQQRWFSSHLAAAAERLLAARAEEAGSQALLLRFWLPTFDNPVIVRLEHSRTGTATLTAVRLSGAGGYEPGKVSDRLERVLTRVEWDRIQSLVVQSHLLEQQPAECTLGLDGSEWIVEVIDRDGYHFLKRWSPESGPVREFGSLLLDLTGWRFGEIY